VSSSRTTEISTSLKFARTSLNELLDLIADAQVRDASIEFIGHKVGNILQSVRQCYDYCAADLRDDFLNKPKISVYYPFHPDSLSRGKALYELHLLSPKTYGELLRIAKCIQSNDKIPNTMCCYGDIAGINNLVNNNKHNCIRRVSEVTNARTLIRGDGGAMISVSPVYPMNPDGTVDYSRPGPVGRDAWTASKGMQISAVKDFQFEDSSGLSRPDVHGLCMMVITATRFILGDVYSVAYGLPDTLFRE